MKTIKERKETDMARDLRRIVNEEGLMNLSKPKLAPLPDTVLMRSLVLLYVVYRHELYNEGRPPKQKQLCDDKFHGFMEDAYALHQLGLIRHIVPCRGAPHLQECAHLLADAGLMTPRTSRPTRRANPLRVLRDDNGDPLIRSEYSLTNDGRKLAAYLFGDKNAVSDDPTVRARAARKGFPAVQQRKDGTYYSAWLDFIMKD